jgi:hypothetical protein
LLVTFHHKLVLMGGHTLVNSFLAPFTVWAVGELLRARCGQHGARPLLAGAVLGVTAYARVDTVILVFATLCASLSLGRFAALGLPTYARVLAGAAGGALVCAFSDYCYYGHWFASPLRWFIANVVYGGSDKYGQADGLFYARALLTEDPVLAGLTVLAAAVMLCGLLQGLAARAVRTGSGANSDDGEGSADSGSSKADDNSPVRLAGLWRAAAICGMALLVYSAHAHKEVPCPGAPTTTVTHTPPTHHHSPAPPRTPHPPLAHRPPPKVRFVHDCLAALCVLAAGVVARLVHAAAHSGAASIGVLRAACALGVLGYAVLQQAQPRDWYPPPPPSPPSRSCPPDRPLSAGGTTSLR